MSKHFWVLLAGSLIFVALFLTLTQDQGTASEVTGHLWLTVLAVKRGLQVAACYLAFVVLVVGHRLLRDGPTAVAGPRGTAEESRAGTPDAGRP